MAYLHINGYQVLTAQGHEISFEETMVRRGYGTSGKYQFGRNHLGRAWRFTTIPLPRDEAQTLAAMLNMLGDHWKFDVAAANRPVSMTESDFYSDKRRAAYNASGIGTISRAQVESCFAGDGALVYDHNGVAQRPYAGTTGFVRCEAGTTNLLPNDEANPEEYNGAGDDLTIVNAATLATNTDRYWTGSGCVKVTTTAGAARGVKTSDIGSLSNATRYVGSVYIRPDAGGETLTLRLVEAGGSNAGSTPVNITLLSDTDTWQRFEVARTTGATAGTLRIEVIDQAAGDAQDFYVDGFQLEAQPTVGATGWVDPDVNTWAGGAGVRPNGDLQYSNLLTDATKGFTVNAWVKHLNTGLGGSTFYAWESGVSGSASSRAYFRFDSSDLPTFVLLNDAEGSTSQVTAQDSAVDEAWHMWTCVYDASTGGAYLYKDGVLVGSDTTYSGNRTFDPSAMTGDFHIGNISSGTTNYAPGPITQFSVLPVAAPAAFILGLYNSAAGVNGGSPGLTPLAAYGDFLGAGEPYVSVYGQVNSMSNVPFQNGASWEPGGTVVEFTLYEATAR